MPPKAKRKKLTQGDTAAPRDAADAKTNALSELFDSAIRLTMCGKPYKLFPGMRVDQEEDEARLTDIAPTLFSPEYLPAISQRAVFLPTIARAFSHSIFVNAQSASLKCKLRILTHRSALATGQNPCFLDATEQTQTVKRDAINQEAQVRLWQMMQRTLYDSNAARRLKPIGFANARSQNNSDPDDMLDDFDSLPVPSADRSILYSLEDEDLLHTQMIDEECIPENELWMEELDDDYVHEFEDMLDC